MMSARLFVPVGTPDHFSAGDTFCPPHPFWSYAWAAGMVPLFWNVDDERVNAVWVAITVTPAIRANKLFMLVNLSGPLTRDQMVTYCG